MLFEAFQVEFAELCISSMTLDRRCNYSSSYVREVCKSVTTLYTASAWSQPHATLHTPLADQVDRSDVIENREHGVVW